MRSNKIKLMCCNRENVQVKRIQFWPAGDVLQLLPTVGDVIDDFLGMFDEVTVESVPMVSVVLGLHVGLEYLTTIVLESLLKQLLGLGGVMGKR